MVYQISSSEQGPAWLAGAASAGLPRVAPAWAGAASARLPRVAPAWAGAASARLPRAGSRSATAGFGWPKARGAEGKGWPRYARVRPTDTATKAATSATAGVRYATLYSRA